jgi:hypothetical protein
MGRAMPGAPPASRPRATTPIPDGFAAAAELKWAQDER